MAARQIRTVSLSRELDRFITDKVASGHYATASEVVRAGLRQLAKLEPGAAQEPLRDADPAACNRSDRANVVQKR